MSRPLISSSPLALFILIPFISEATSFIVTEGQSELSIGLFKNCLTVLFTCCVCLTRELARVFSWFVAKFAAIASAFACREVSFLPPGFGLSRLGR